MLKDTESRTTTAQSRPPSTSVPKLLVKPEISSTRSRPHSYDPIPAELIVLRRLDLIAAEHHSLSANANIADPPRTSKAQLARCFKVDSGINLLARLGQTSSAQLAPGLYALLAPSRTSVHGNFLYSQPAGPEL
jgi:hypothetical protein